MNYAFMTYSCPDLGFRGVLETARQYGYDGVEPRISSRQQHGVERDIDAAARREARDMAEQVGVAICCIATSCRFSDPETVESAVADAHKALDLAADLGAPTIRVFAGVIAEGLSRDDAVAQVVNSMNQLKDHAVERNVIIAIETHDDWCDPANVARVINGVNHPAIRVNWDLMHPVFTAGKTIDESFDVVKPWISHVHFHDCARVNNERVLVPAGEGIVDHRRAMELLKSIKYEGFISGEWIRWRPAEDHLPQELATLKRYEKDIS